MSGKKIFFSVGEPSGDLHAANLIRELKLRDPSLQLSGFGGPRMQSEGCQILFDLTQLSLMLFSLTLIKTLPKFFALKKQTARYFDEQRPDAVVLIDFPGFNWHIARLAKQRGIPVFYYGVPQMWAWASHRVKKLRRDVDHVLCKLPFEPKWFQERGCNSVYVGHPYFDELHQRKLDQQFIQSTASDVPVLTLLPGSRVQEVSKNIEGMLDAANRVRSRIPNLRVVVASFSRKQADLVKEAINFDDGIEIFVGKTPELIEMATVCIACSGSVSLELMFHRKPSVIFYRVGRRDKILGRLVLRCKYITLPNLMAIANIEKPFWKLIDPDASHGERVPFPEYFSTRNEADRMSSWMVRWLENPEERQVVIDQLDELNQRFSAPGASIKAAEYILQELANNSALNSNNAYAA